MEQDAQIGEAAGGQVGGELRRGRSLEPAMRAKHAPKHTLGRLMTGAVFERPPERIAPLLLGKLLVHKTFHGILAGRIVETEAYLGPHTHPGDRAAHSHRGPTPRNQVLFGPAAYAYVYSIYGRYYCMNVTCEKTGRAGCILIRALDPVAGLGRMAHNRGLSLGAAPRELTRGPGRLCQALALTRSVHNGLDLLDPASPLQLRDDDFTVRKIVVTRRIGIRHAVELPLRFTLPEHPCVSGPKSLTGNCIFLRATSVHLFKPLKSRAHR